MTAVLALDLSKTRTGWAAWERGAPKPRYGSWVLGSEYSTDGQVFVKLHQRLMELRQVIAFETIYYEQPIPAGKLNERTNVRSLYLASGLAAHTESFGTAMKCQTFAIHIDTWRKDFIGADLVKDAQAAARAKKKLTGKGSARDKLKRLTMARCRQLGLSPRFDDEGDAIGILDFALDFHEHVRPPWRAEEVLRAPLEVRA